MLRVKRLLYILISCIGAMLLFATSLNASLAQIPTNFAAPDFQALWARTDFLIYDGELSRSYLWGPEPFTAGVQEPYAQSPGGKRLVQYLDKSRMEITNPQGDRFSPYFVTNGLLVRELVTGQLQVGDAQFESRQPASIGVAGDADDTTGPTYQTFGSLIGQATENTSKETLITRSVDRAGHVLDDPQQPNPIYTQYRVKTAVYEATTHHNVAQPFWSFLNQTGPIFDGPGQVSNGRLFDPVYYATGLPISEAWWAKVKVGGQTKDVLMQAFERRVLTYTPSNPTAFQVEMGNVGRHYYLWRYGN